MIKIVRPDALGTYESFQQIYENVIHKGQFSDCTPTEYESMTKQSRCLNKLAKAIIHRRDYSFLSKLVPKKFEFVLNIRSTDIQMKLYKV